MSSPPPSPCAPGRRTDARAGTDPCRPSAQHPSRPDAGRALLGPGRSRGLSRGRADATGVGDRPTQGRHGPPRLAARGRKTARRREPGPACPAVSEEAAGTTLLAAACRTSRGRAGSARSRRRGPAGLTAAPRGLCGTRGHARLRGMRLGGAGAPLLRARDLLPRTRIQSCGCRRHSGAVSTSRVLHSLVTLRTRVCGRTASEGTELGGHFYSGALSPILQDSGRTRPDQTFSPRPAWGVGVRGVGAVDTRVAIGGSSLGRCSSGEGAADPSLSIHDVEPPGAGAERWWGRVAAGSHTGAVLRGFTAQGGDSRRRRTPW